MQLLGSVDVLGSDAYANEAGYGAAEDGEGGEQAEEKRRLDGAGFAEEADQEMMCHHLEGLRDAGGEFAAALDVGEGDLGDESGAERGGEDVGGGDGVLDSEGDADAADGRRGVCGVS